MDLTTLDCVEQPVDAGSFTATVSTGRHLQLDSDIVAEYDLAETVIDATLTFTENTAPLTDIRVDKQGRICVPKQTCDLYGFEVGDHVEVDIETVVFR